MANSGPLGAGRAFVELFADDSKLVRGPKQVTREQVDAAFAQADAADAKWEEARTGGG